MTTIPVTFAMRGANPVHISQVANGLACGCVCPGCGDHMVAKKGPIKIHHFAHDGGSDCARGLQTMLHLVAKEILSKERQMVLPELELLIEVLDASGRSRKVKGKALAIQSVMFDEVTLEKRLGDIIPDVICKFGGRTLLVEVGVTHFIDKIKAEKIRAMNIDCIEIDLRPLLRGQHGWNWQTLKKAVVDGDAYKTWIARQDGEHLRAEVQRREQQKIDLENHAILEAKRMEIPGWSEAIRRLDEFKISGLSQQERDALDSAGPKEQTWLSAASLMNLDWDNPPYYIDVPVSGEDVFLVARKVWQAALYAVFIVGQVDDPNFPQRPGKVNDSIPLIKAVWWCTRTFPIRPELDLLYKHTELLTPDQKEALPSVHGAVRAYLMALADLGYVKTSSAGLSFQIQEDAPHWKGRIPR